MATVNLIGSYNYALVALSVLIAIFASYAALDLAGRVTAARGWTRAVWLLGGAGAMGIGIWSMHYIGMLAFILPIPVAYHWPTVLLSLFAAIFASVIALGMVSRQEMGWFRALAGSVLMGAGIAGMHYIGMAAMRLPAICQFDSFLVILSVVFAVLISLAALWIAFHFRNEETGIGWEKLTGAVVMGAAIPVMHYTGMAAASFTASELPVDLSHAVSISTLGPAGIATVTFIVLGLALLTSWVDRRFATRTLEVQEEKLQQSEAYLAEAQRLSHTGSFGWKASTGEIIWSEETFRIFQYDRSTKPTVELILQRVDPEDTALVKQTIERASRDGRDFDFEHRLLMPDGSVKYVHVVAHALNDVSGSVEFVGAVMDVTAAKRVEESLRQTENYLAEAQRLTHTGSWAWRVAGRDASHLSDEWYRIYGFDPEEGLSAWEKRLERMHPEDRAKWQETTDRAIREKSDYEGEHRILLPDGTVKHTHTVGHPVLNASGDVVEFVGTMMDVTDRKRAEEALRQSEAYLAEAQRLSHTGSWAGAPGAVGEIRYWSEECYRVLGFDPQDGQPRVETFFQRIHPEDQARTIEQLERAGREKAEFAFDYRIIHPGGEIRSIHTVGHPVLSPSGELLEFVGTVIDVTERKRAEEERERLRQAQADLARVNRVTTMGELTASLAHEVNQPIAAALTNANTCLRWLARDVPDVEEARAAAMRIVKDQTRAAEIVSRIRMLFKKGSAQRESVDVNEVIQEMIVLLRGETTRYSISVRAELASDLPQVSGDRVQLQQVLMNLMINGIDAMKEVGGTRELTIKAQRAKNKEVIVSVSDTGVGLPPQQAEQIFNAFFTTKAHGTGMGLRISRSIVESHDGRLWAADNPPRGTTFLFTLPAKVEADEFPPRSQAWIQ
jgi:PAS domain S-box-containing protein